MSRVCEEFGVLPSQAVQEIESERGHLVYKILHLRSFADAYRKVRAHEKAVQKGLKPDPLEWDEMTELVGELDLEAAKARIAARKGRTC